MSALSVGIVVLSVALLIFIVVSWLVLELGWGGTGIILAFIIGFFLVAYIIGKVVIWLDWLPDL